MDQQTTHEIPDWIKSDRLTDFIEELREEGYKIGISQYIAAQKLVLTLMTREKLWIVQALEGDI